jgi:hypothetical protein
MGLTLGKSFDRNYNLRIPFLNGFYDLGIFLNKNSTFLLFSADKEFLKTDERERSVPGSKLSMFKNLKASKFCETFLEFHSYNGTNLDIVDQFSKVRDVYSSHISTCINETILLSKIKIEDKDIFDTLIIYGFTLCAYPRDFIFVLAERQNIVRRLNTKIVRSTGLQIATANSLKLLEEFSDDYITFGKKTPGYVPNSENIVNLDQIQNKKENTKNARSR